MQGLDIINQRLSKVRRSTYFVHNINTMTHVQNFTTGLHSEICVNKLLVELCVGGYTTNHGLVSGAEWAFKGLGNSCEVEFHCLIHKTFFLYYVTTIKTVHLLEIRMYIKHEIYFLWKPIKLISKDVEVGSNFTHKITRTQFPIQLVVAHTIHQAQGLIQLFGSWSKRVYKHGLICINPH